MGRKALITFSPDGTLVAMSGQKRSITVWDAETGALKATLFGGLTARKESAVFRLALTDALRPRATTTTRA